ncbi:MAG: hypothetical protein PUA81_05300 [Oscillospiraceae bacterium]|nr:hypothetical protein [Oscillospiraceae bacterium]
MKDKFIKAAKAVSFALILVILLEAASVVLYPDKSFDSFGAEMERASGVVSEEKNTIDVLIIGDSEAYTSVIPMIIWEKHAITSYVCSTGSQPLYDSVFYMKLAAENQKPKAVVLETNTVFRELDKEQYLLSELQKQFSVFRFHNNWKTLGETYSDKGKDSAPSALKGYIPNFDTRPAVVRNYMAVTETAAEIPPENMACIDEIRNFCNDNGIEFILASVPSILNWNYSKHLAVEEYAEKYGLKFIDMNLDLSKVGIDWTADTFDGGDHINYSGALKTTEYFGSFLANEVGLEGHKGDEKYSQWDKQLPEFYRLIEEKSEETAGNKKKNQ